MSMWQALRDQARRIAEALSPASVRTSGQYRALPVHLPTASLDSSPQWKAKVEASRQTEAFADALAPRLPQEVRPYLYRLIMRDAYPQSLKELLELSVAYRSNLYHLFHRGCAPSAEYEDAEALGPAFEAAVASLLNEDANPLFAGKLNGDA